MLLPGEELTITLECGYEFAGKVLAGKGQRELMRLLRKAATLEDDNKTDEAMDLGEDILEILTGDRGKAEELYATLVDYGMTLEIAWGVLNKGKLSEEQEKN